MEKILFVNACVRPESRTMILAQHLLPKLGGKIEEITLDKEKIAPMDGSSIDARVKAVDDHAWDAPILRYARQFVSADEIVIAAPYWDLSFPSMLKNYLEAVTVCGVTFYYTPEGYPVGLCQAKRLIYVTTAGGPILEPDHGFGYVRELAETFYGIPEVIRFSAENLDIVGADVPAILEKTIEEIDAWNHC